MTMLAKYTHTKRAFIAGYAILMLLFIYWAVTRESGLNLTVLAMQAIPLLVFIPGLIHNHYRTYSWLCFILLFYFIKAVEGVFSSNSTGSDWVFLALTVLLFVASMFASRWAQRLKIEGQL